MDIPIFSNNKCPNWTWFYPYEDPPQTLSKEFKATFSHDNPCTVNEYLSCILPYKSKRSGRFKAD